MRPSSQQVQVYDEVVNQTSRHLNIEATAGSGKTTTILEATRLLAKVKRPLLLSFSNQIVEELKKKAQAHVDVKTLHSIGYSTLRSGVKNSLELSPNKYFGLAIKLLEAVKFDRKRLMSQAMALEQLFGLMRLTLTDFAQEEEVYNLMSHHNIDLDDEHLTMLNQLNLASTGLRDNKIDFTDMLYLPYKLNLSPQAREFVALDEAQDCSKVQHDLLNKLVNGHGRLMSVGDPFQAIYGFAGSANDSFSLLANKPETKKLPLLTCFRCPKLIVAEARNFNYKINHYDLQEEGKITRNGRVEDIKPQDLVLSRTTKPLVTLFYQLIDMRLKAKIIGKDTEKQLLELAMTIESAHSIDRAYLILERQLELLYNVLLTKGVKNPYTHYKYENLDEKVKVLRLMLTHVARPGLLPKHVGEVFNQNAEGVTLMTIHRSKGLEFDHVFIIEKYNDKKLMPSAKAVLGWEKVQENNLQFVATTRSKKTITYLNINLSDDDDANEDGDQEPS